MSPLMVDLMHRDETHKGEDIKGLGLEGISKGSCSVDADVGYVWAAYVSRHRAHGDRTPVVFTAPLGRMPFSIPRHYPFYFISIFCQSGMKAQGALELT